MGEMVIQKIYTCTLCDATPEDGEKIWLMGINNIWCERCTNAVYEEEILLDKNDNVIQQEE